MKSLTAWLLLAAGVYALVLRSWPAAIFGLLFVALALWGGCGWR